MLLEAHFGRFLRQTPSPAVTPDEDLLMDTLVLRTVILMHGRKEEAMATHHSETSGFQKLLEQKETELGRLLRKRDDIAIEKSADQMDEIQYASERDLAIRNVDRESSLLRDVKAALRRLHLGTFGNCLDCQSEISPKRLNALPWAARCIRCQETADNEQTTDISGLLVNAA